MGFAWLVSGVSNGRLKFLILPIDDKLSPTTFSSVIKLSIADYVVNGTCTNHEDSSVVFFSFQLTKPSREADSLNFPDSDVNRQSVAFYAQDCEMRHLSSMPCGLIKSELKWKRFENYAKEFPCQDFTNMFGVMGIPCETLKPNRCDWSRAIWVRLDEKYVQNWGPSS